MRLPSATPGDPRPADRKAVIVTGASSGLGAAVARLLGSTGWAVTVNYHSSPDKARDVVAAIEESGGTAVAVGADASDPDGVAALVDATVHRFGRVDAAVANAHVPFTPATLESTDLVNLTGKMDGEIAAAFHLTRSCLPIFKRQGGGRLVLISSLQSHGPAAPGMIANGVGKAALAAFGRYAAWELGRYGVTVNTVSPSLVNTQATAHLPDSFRGAMQRATPLGRLSEPEDVAHAVAFLVGEHGGFTTGIDLSAGGGFGLSWLPQVGPDLLDSAQQHRVERSAS